MSEQSNFYTNLGKVLLVFNFLSLFFTFTIILIYAFIQYVGVEILTLAEDMMDVNGTFYASMVDIFELALELPGGLDTVFMAIIILSVANILYMAYRTQQGGWIGFFFFISIGLPIWLYIASKIVDLRNEFLNYLHATMLVKPSTTFFDYFTIYSLEVTAAIFVAAIIVHMVDWGNVRERVSGALEKEGSASDDLIEERFEQ